MVATLDISPSVTTVKAALDLLRSAMQSAPPASASGEVAAAMARVLAETERLASSGVARYAARVQQSAAHEHLGHPDAAGWLAGVSGAPVGRAREVLATAARLDAAPGLSDAYERGELSFDQAKVIAGVAAEDPQAAAALARQAGCGSFSELREAAERAKRLARGERSEVAKESRAHRGRYCRVRHVDEGGMRFEAWVTRADGGRILAALERETQRVFEAARGDGEREPHERYRADALVRLLCASGGPRALALVRVDATALRRGALESGEVCEIAGVGPIPVATARDLLGDCLYQVVVADGVDVRTVTGTKRTIPHALRTALVERDRTCVVPGCGVAHHLEIDHWRQDFALGGPTSLDNLARLCGRHHAMKTNLGWRLAGGPGRWRWLPPV